MFCSKITKKDYDIKELKLVIFMSSLWIKFLDLTKNAVY